MREAFVRLYREGLIYRGRYIVNWCPRCMTALSDLEVVHQERQGHLWHIRYPVAGSAESLVVATTRPETMLGDTAVAVHPDDERYRHLLGKKVLLPLMNREIPIIADTFADREFGTGVVKVTPAHDPNDFEAGRRHNLPQIDVMTADGKMNEAAGAYAGLDRFEARKRIVADLQELGLLERITDHTHCGRHLRPLQDRGRAARLRAVVLPDEAAGAGSDGRGREQGTICGRPGEPAHHLLQLDVQHPRLVHLAPAVVGPPHSHLALRGLQGDDAGDGLARDRSERARAGRRCAGQVLACGSANSRRTPTCWTPGSARGCGRFRRWAGPTTPPTCATSIRPAC